MAKFADKDLVDQVIAARDASKSAFHTKLNWARRSWSAYNNEASEVDKEDWQSKARVPKWAMAVDQATSLFKTSLRTSARLFGIEVLNDDPVDKALAAFYSTIMHEFMRRKEVGFISSKADALKVGLVTNMAIEKYGWASFENTEYAPQVVARQIEVKAEDGTVIGFKQTSEFDTREVSVSYSHPRITVVDPLRFFPDPTGNNLYNIHEVKRDLWQVLEMGKGLFDRQALAELEKEDWGEGPDVEDADEDARAQMVRSNNAWRKKTKITEYWGPVFERGSGKLLKKNQLVTVANDRLLLRIDTFPYWDGRDPFVFYNMIRVPFNVWGKLLFQHSDSLQVYVNEMLNLILDSLKMTVLKPFTIDVSLLDDVEDILTGLFPGKSFKMRGEGGVKEMDMRGPGADSFQGYGLLASELQNSHGVTEFLAGLPTSRGRATATETNIKTQQSAGFFDGIMADVEENGAEPSIKKFFDRMMQFMDDWSDPAVVQIARRFGVESILPALEQDPVVRYKLMKRPFRFRAAGLNAAMKRAEIMDKIQRLIEFLGQVPEFMSRIKGDKLFEKIVEGLDMQDLIQQVGTQPGIITPQPFDAIQAIPQEAQEALAGLMGQMGLPAGAQPNRPADKR